MNDILISNYIEALKGIQRLFYAGCISIIPLFGILYAGGVQKNIPVSGTNITLLPFPALLLAVCIYFGAGLLAASANHQRIRIRRRLSAEDVYALDTYPALSNGGVLLQIVVLTVPTLIFLLVFLNGKSPMHLLPALGSTLLVSSGFIGALMPAWLLDKLDSINVANWRR